MTVPDPQTERAGGAGRVLGLLVLVLLGIGVWWFFFADAPEQTVETEVPAAGAPVTQPEDVAEPPAETGPELAVVMADPAPYLGQSMEATATVDQVLEERALWLAADGGRMLVVVDPRRSGFPAVEPGDTVQLNEAIVMDVETAGLERVLEPLEEDVHAMVEQEGHFLLVAPEGVVSPMAPSEIAEPGDTLR